MDVEQNNKEMMAWFDKNKDKYLGKGFTKRRYVPTRETRKEKEWVDKSSLPRNIHYGDEYDKNAKLVESWTKNGHSINLWSDGNLTCDCQGWIFKRAGIGRECVHVREKYADLADKPVPEKKKPKKPTVASIDLISRIEMLLDRRK